MRIDYINNFLKVFTLFSFLSFSVGVCSTGSLNKLVINEAIKIIFSATESCDYKTATQYYYSGTKIYSYTDGKLDTSDTWPDISNVVKKMFERCDIKYLSNDIIKTEVEFLENMKVASHISEYKRVSEIGGSRQYGSHVVETTKFGVVDGKLVILESHSNFIKFERIK